MSETPTNPEAMTVRAFRETDGLADWPVVENGATAFFPTDAMATSARLVAAVAAIDGIDDGHVSIDVRPAGVTVRLLTKSDEWWGMSRRDVELARSISAAAAELGLSPDSSNVQSVAPIVVGAADVRAVMPFWEALLGYARRADSPEEDLVDPRGVGPGVWFEAVEDPADGRPRMHVAVWLPSAQAAEARVQAVLAAGGRVVDDRFAPAWWTLADPEGNEADIATTTGRD